MTFPYDEIGRWSEIKLEIIKKYALAYSRILENQKNFRHIYIDAFAGAGIHVSRETKGLIKGSPVNALLVDPPFDEYYFIDLDEAKIESLQEIIQEHTDKKVFVHQGDCNELLPKDIFPEIKYKEFRRAFCLLDPYGLHLNWEVILKAGQMETIEILLNFPVMDMNMNILRKNPEAVDPTQIKRMNAFWGDESWRDAMYDTSENLFGWEDKTGNNETIVDAFRDRLKTMAGFKYVSKSLPMKNGKNAVVYYLLFASQNSNAKKIMDDIFKKHRSF